MRVERFEGEDERRILTGMLVDPVVLGRISPHWDKGLFQSQWGNLIGKWAIDYYTKYSKAPGKDIVGLFARWAAKSQDKDTTTLVDRFLSGLSDEYTTLAQESNSSYVIDLAGRHFNKVRLTTKAERIKDALEQGNVELAQTIADTPERVELGVGAGIDVLESMEAVQTAFEEKTEPLIEYPGAAGQFFRDSLERDGFIAFLGPEKSGKTRWLLDVAWRGMLQRRKVAFFEVGDMSQGQIMRRFASRAARRPLKAPRGQGWPCTLEWPTGIDRLDGQRWADVAHEERAFDRPLSWQMTWKACEEIIKKKTRSKTPLLKLACYPHSTISIPGIVGVLQSWERSGWLADVVVIDYADILAPISNKFDKRDQINETWGAMRALSQSMHCLVVTATQANAKSYGAETVNRSHFSDDKRKLAHVTGMIGISQMSEEKARGVTRLGWAAVRELEDGDGHCLHCVGVPAINHPCMFSCW